MLNADALPSSITYAEYCKVNLQSLVLALQDWQIIYDGMAYLAHYSQH